MARVNQLFYEYHINWNQVVYWHMEKQETEMKWKPEMDMEQKCTNHCCNVFFIQWNLITVTLGPNLAGCYIEVAFLLSDIPKSS